MADPTFLTAHIRTAEKYPIIPVNSRLTSGDALLPMGMQVTIMSEDGINAVVRFAYNKKVYQAVVPQGNLMIDFRVIFRV